MKKSNALHNSRHDKIAILFKNCLEKLGNKDKCLGQKSLKEQKRKRNKAATSATFESLACLAYMS